MREDQAGICGSFQVACRSRGAAASHDAEDLFYPNGLCMIMREEE